jgi:transcriptional regulator with GAF, ATPase, and Fis domain
VLEQTGWKVSGKNSAAEILGLDRSTLRARMRKLGSVSTGVKKSTGGSPLNQANR